MNNNQHKHGPKGSFMWINKAELKVNHDDYQRSNIAENKVREIAKDWNWSKCGALVVSFRDDGFWIIDGQHRKTSADALPEVTELPCIVFESDSIQSEAASFLGINGTRTNVGAFDKFRALLTSQNKLAIQVQQLIQGSGRELSASASNSKVACVARIWQMATQDINKLTRIWPLVCDICSSCQVSDKILAAVWVCEGRLSNRGASLAGPEYRAILTKLGKEIVIASISRASATIGISNPRVWANGLAKEMNKHIKKQPKIPLED